MVYTQKISDAIEFAYITHQIDQKQMRKGGHKDMPAITHLLAVGLILARAGADEDTIVAGILHDTIEDSIDAKKVTPDDIEEGFGNKVKNLVESVTENKKDPQGEKIPWEVRKREALEHIKTFSHESLLLKSADTIHNVSELLYDYKRDKENAFEGFSRTKEETINNYLKVLEAILESWSENPLTSDIERIMEGLKNMEKR